MNPFGKKQIDSISFAQFLELNDSEMYVWLASFARLITEFSG